MNSYYDHRINPALPPICGALWPSQIRAAFLRAFPSLLASALCLLAVWPAQAQTTQTNIWVGTAGDTNWSTAGNWTNNLLPTPTSFVILTNYGSTGLPGAPGAPNIIVTNDTAINALQIMNTNITGFHNILINPGVTLSISNNVAPAPEILYVGATKVNTTELGIHETVYATIQGAGGTLLINCTNGLTKDNGYLYVADGTIGVSAPPTIDPVRGTLDLSGLDNFNASLNRICVGADGVLGDYLLRPQGSLYLARTNVLRLMAFSSTPSGFTHGIQTGSSALSGGGYSRFGDLYFGQTNAIFCDTGIGIGLKNNTGTAQFNPSNATSFAYFRNLAGTGRQSTWGIGDHSANSGHASLTAGIADFSLGTIDAMVTTLNVGRSGNGNGAASAHCRGSLTFASGTLDVTTVEIGYQGTANSPSIAPGGEGIVNVNNTALLTVGGNLRLGRTSVSQLANDFYGGTLNISNGGQVVVKGSLITGVNSSNTVNVVGGSSLTVAKLGNTLSSTEAPLGYFHVSSGALTLDLGTLINPTTPICTVSNLETEPSIALTVLGSSLLRGRLTLIKYQTWTGSLSDFATPTLPTVLGYLTNNVANSSIDLVITNSSNFILTWNGQTNGVNVGDWDITTADWLKGATPSAYAQGSVVQFDDTALGTTTVNLTANLAPSFMFVTNLSKPYTFTGPGALSGVGGLQKDGSASLILANSGSNSFSGAVTINKGTVQIGGTANRLPATAAVTLADDSSAKLDLNNLNQTIGGLSGGGPSGGNVTLGSGNLFVGGGGTYAGVISGTGMLIKTNSGVLTLSAANTYSGGTLITNSTSIIVQNSTGSGLGSGGVTINGGTLQIGNNGADGSISAGFITNNGLLILNNISGDYTFDKVISGSGSVQIITPNTVYFTNANSYAGQTLVAAGTLQISHPNALGTVAGNTVIGNAALELTGDITVAEPMLMTAKTAGVLPSPAHIINVSGTNTLTGTITGTGSTVWTVASEGGKLIVTGQFTNDQVAANSYRIFGLRGGSDGEWRSSIGDGFNHTTPTQLRKDDGGTWTLTGTNGYTGGTFIYGGLLVVNGALTGPTNVMVYNGATLAGIGFIAAPVTNVNGIISPGNASIGTLTISNALTLAAGSTCVFDVSTLASDQIRGLTTVNYDGLLQVVQNGDLSANEVFKLFDATNYSGTFNSFDLPSLTSPLTWDTSFLTVDGTLRIIGGPEVTSYGFGGTSNFHISGTGAADQPYQILATTNVSLPLSSWTQVSSGTFAGGVFTFTDTDAAHHPQRFYRVVSP